MNIQKLCDYTFTNLSPRAKKRDTIKIPSRNTLHKETAKTKWDRFLESLDDEKKYTFYTIKKEWQQYIELSGAEIKQFIPCKNAKYRNCFVNDAGVLLYIDGYSVYLHKLINDRGQSNSHPYYSVHDEKYDPHRIVFDEFGTVNCTKEALKAEDSVVHHVGVDGYRDFYSTSILTEDQHRELHKLSPIPRGNIDEILKNLPPIEEEVKKIASMGVTSPKLIIAKSGKITRDCDMMELPTTAINPQEAYKLSDLFKAVYQML